MHANHYYCKHKQMETNTAAAQPAALAQPTRLDISRALVVSGDPGLSAGVLAGELNVSPLVLSFHLKFLTKNYCTQSMNNHEIVRCNPASVNQSVDNDVRSRLSDTSKP